ncbi:sigma-70 family RNA polymerase sigma factor [Treponema bryantii]|uniref:sigma-70 family RNA polymerase sigma factor n=1 Tax=Treponema bryantii TaxID=163 RepID=UPI0003B74197|nr:sigma-70 family RNA polymerase sigma factor [Treponema bryantii]
MSMSKYPHFNILSREEEYELAVQAANGNAKARNLLVLSNIPYAIKYSRSFKGYNFDDEDLVQIGLIGLIEAVDKFDFEKGFRIITYAKNWIRKEIMDAAGKSLKNPACPINRKNDPDFDEEAFLSSLCDNSKNSVEEECINNEMIGNMKKALTSLSSKEADILTRHYGLNYKEPQAFSEIAESYGLSKARIHQLEQAALSTLKNELDGLHDFYDLCA